ncbi:unnamed protein product, partial [Prorocentrum cordatum]
CFPRRRQRRRVEAGRARRADGGDGQADAGERRGLPRHRRLAGARRRAQPAGPGLGEAKEECAGQGRRAPRERAGASAYGAARQSSRDLGDSRGGEGGGHRERVPGRSLSDGEAAQHRRVLQGRRHADGNARRPLPIAHEGEGGGGQARGGEYYLPVPADGDRHHRAASVRGRFPQ